MKLLKTEIEGAYLVEQTSNNDDRGFFARWYCEQVMTKQNLNIHWKQMNNSGSQKANTLRGLHLQLSPSQETKLVRCISGSIWDVIVDLRIGSKTFKKWIAFELSSANKRSLYVPEGCAHGFLTLVNNSEIIYLVSKNYDPSRECTLRWDDPDIGIKWPAAPSVISDKDKHGSTFKDLEDLLTL